MVGLLPVAFVVPSIRVGTSAHPTVTRGSEIMQNLTS
jgi:hypothetical protein